MTLACLRNFLIATMLLPPLSATDSADANTTSPTDSDNITGTGNGSTVLEAGPYADWQMALIAIACGILVVGTIVGNVLVVTAVAIVRRLRTPSNLLIVSLAISDLLVGVLVMPFAAMYEVRSSFHFT